MTASLRKLVAVVSILAMSLVAVPAASAAPGDRFPDTINLPDGFFPEGITIDQRQQVAYVGSLAGGAIQRLDLKTGEATEFAPFIGADALAVGMTVDSFGRLWVATGGPALTPTTQPGFRVYDTATGELLVDQPVAAGFVNDVITTRDAAWFTDSFSPNLIRVPIASDGSIGTAESVALGGDWVQTQGFSANGIVATPNQKHLIVAQATGPEPGSSALYVVSADASTPSLDATRIALDVPLLSGDGLVLVGRTLYVVGGPGVTKIKLDGRLASGAIVDVLTVPGALSPTTADVFGNRLYVADARFPQLGDPTATFAIKAIPR